MAFPFSFFKQANDLARSVRQYNSVFALDLRCFLSFSVHGTSPYNARHWNRGVVKRKARPRWRSADGENRDPGVGATDVMLSSGWRGTISNFAIYLDVPIPADWHTKPGLNVACGLSSPLLGPFLFGCPHISSSGCIQR